MVVVIVFWGAIWESVDINAPANRANTLGNIWTNMLANMLAWFAILHFSKQKTTNILGFSFIRLLTIYQECQSVKQQHVWQSPSW